AEPIEAERTKRAAYSRAVEGEPEDNTDSAFSFSVDAKAPDFTGVRMSPENAMMLTELDRYIAKGDTVWPVKRAVPVPAGKQIAIKNHVNKHHKDYKWSIQKIPGNPKQVWLYKAAKNTHTHHKKHDDE